MTRTNPTEPPTVLVLLALGDYGSRMLAGVSGIMESPVGEEAFARNPEANEPASRTDWIKGGEEVCLHLRSSPSSAITSATKYTKHTKSYPNKITRAVPRARGSGIPFPADGPVAQKQQAYNSKNADGPSALRQTGSANSA